MQAPLLGAALGGVGMGYLATEYGRRTVSISAAEIFRLSSFFVILGWTCVDVHSSPGTDDVQGTPQGSLDM